MVYSSYNENQKIRLHFNFVISLGYSLVQIPDMFVYIYGILKRRWQNSNRRGLIGTGATRPESITFTTESPPGISMLQPDGVENKTQKNYRNHDEQIEEMDVKDSKMLYWEVGKIVSQIYWCNEKLEHIKLKISEME